MNKPCPLHVMHIVSGDLWAGAEVQLFTLTKTLHTQMEATVTVVIMNHGKLERMLENEAIKVIVLNEENLNGIQILRQLVAIVRKLNPDVIHTHRNKENILGSVAARLSGNIPTLRTQHGAPEHRPKWRQIPKQIIRLMDWFCGQYLQQKIIAVSDELAELLRQEFHADKVHVIENGIDIESTLRSVAGEKPVHIQPSQPLNVGIAGRLVSVKRMDLFIKTARLLKENHPEMELNFHIFGDGPLKEDLEALNQKLETHGYVTLEGHCDDLAPQLRTLDILVMASDHEGLPMTLLEAMALQTPIIAHRVGGIPKLLAGGDCGVLVDDHTPSGYAQAIHQLARNPEGRVKIAENAFIRVKKFYSATKNAQAFCEFYLEISSNPAKVG